MPKLLIADDHPLFRAALRGAAADAVANLSVLEAESLDGVLDALETHADIDLVLLMSVNPGFGGQSFIAGTLAKLRAVRQRLDAHEQESGRRIRLEVDGGVKIDNIAAIAAAGADTFVAGSAVFGAARADDAHRYDSVIAALRAELAATTK